MKLKQCSSCGKETYLWKANPPLCKACSMKYKGKVQIKKKVSQKRLNAPKKTGELELFLKIYAERGGKCEITGERIKFDPWCFAHILSKGTWGKFRLNPDNIIMVKKEIHMLYDNDDRDHLLYKYPRAEIIYQRKEELKSRYHE